MHMYVCKDRERLYVCILVNMKLTYAGSVDHNNALVHVNQRIESCQHVVNVLWVARDMKLFLCVSALHV